MKLLIVVLVLTAVASSVYGIYGNKNQNQNGAGYLCLVQNANAQFQDPNNILGCVYCTVASAASLSNCIGTLSVGNLLTQYCSSNTTNSTIPTGTCTFCTSNQLVFCGETDGTIGTGDFISDAVFGCLIRTCSASPSLVFFGLVPVRVTQKIFVGLTNNNNNGAALIGKRSADDQPATTSIRSFLKDFYYTKVDGQTKDNKDTYSFVGYIKDDLYKDSIPTKNVEISSDF